MRAFALTTMIAVGLAVAGCSNNPQLMNIQSGQDGPDEFAILPTKPLSMPADLNVLPAPSPGGANITDPTPFGDAVGALGGNPQRLADNGIAAADGGLVNYSSRYGVQPGIRSELAVADRAWRSANSRRLLETLAQTSVYMRAYRPMMLDPTAELLRWRRAGAQTPSAPPRIEE
ncbi:DUF3035 domain-containing protein [Paracoccus tegillarcae]|uniref:DUF3035 domain-containing protein n=1 Tax=Paracoccus tegillarcae TaxID=1529068 RepID=A0A2K9EZD7_9RHOB|nr:DUF3035 domain-containing protein [Paracoccus tegillarcae]AUH33472.1 DUF3035 domain-containing protein [Paracoccus tegillarcae]